MAFHGLAALGENADRLRPLRGRCGFRREPPIHETPFNLAVAAGALKRFAVIGFGVEDRRLQSGHGIAWLLIVIRLFELRMIAERQSHRALELFYFAILSADRRCTPAWEKSLIADAEPFCFHHTPRFQSS